MPYRPAFFERYDRLLEPAIREAGLTAELLNKKKGSFDIATETRERIAACSVFLADVTHQAGRANGNVYHEVGFAQGLCKPVITLLQSDESVGLGRRQRSVAFNLQGIRHLNIPPSAESELAEAFRKQLVDQLRAAKEHPEEFMVFRGRQVLDRRLIEMILELHARSAHLAVLDAFDRILAEPGQGAELEIPDLYQPIGGTVAAARDLMKWVEVEVSEEAELSKSAKTQRLSLPEFAALIVNSAKHQYNMRVLKIVEDELKSPDDALTKRMRLSRRLAEFTGGTFRRDAESLLKNAWFDETLG